MTYKETLFFIAKCLTISFEEKNKAFILLKLQSEEINWDVVVKISTNHYVLPALYCNLMRAGFLQYLPQDLVLYMDHITSLNRERNKQIITQVKNLNSLLLANNITPLFLKGTGNLLAGLYEDIAERMVGDIDLIISKENYSKTITVLKDDGYTEIGNYKYHIPTQMHYRRITKEKNIAAVEIHQNLILEKYVNEFDYYYVEKDSQLINDFMVLSYENKLNLSISSYQINDIGYYYNTINLRNAYDVFLLSKKTNAKKSFSKFKTLRTPLNCFLAICHVVFGEINSLEYHKTKKTETYLSVFDSLLLNERKRKSRIKSKYRKVFIKNRLSIIYKSIFNKEYRDWFLKRIADKSWQREKMAQLGFKKKS